MGRCRKGVAERREESRGDYREEKGKDEEWVQKRSAPGVRLG